MLRYIGSKRWLREKVEEMIPLDTEILPSPFFGSGQVEYFVAQKRPNIRVHGSDLFRPIVNFHQHLPVDGIRQFVDNHLDLDSYKDLVKGISEVDDRTSAILAYVLLHFSFMGKFGTFDPSRKPISERILAPMDKLKQLQNIEVCHGDALDVLQMVRGAGQKICLFLDPPYVTKYKDRYYGGKRQVNLAEFHEKLASAVKETGVPFIMSIHDSEEIRELYKDFSIQSVRKRELLISNL